MTLAVRGPRGHALHSALRSVYQEVSVLKSNTDAAAIKEADVSYIFSPMITTNSSSSSLLTWPPTDFTTDLICTVTDAQGSVLAQLRTTGVGAAEFSEFKSDLSLAARRSVADVADKLTQQIRQSEKLR